MVISIELQMHSTVKAI